MFQSHIYRERKLENWFKRTPERGDRMKTVDVSLEYFFRLRREVGIARNELLGEGMRNPTLNTFLILYGTTRRIIG